MSRPQAYRIRRTEEIRQKQQNALDSTIFILREFGPASFLLQDEEHHKFKVFIGEQHTCTCQEFRTKQDLCIHIYWVLLKRYKVDPEDPVSWQLGLVEREILDVLDGKHSRTVPLRLKSGDKKDTKDDNAQPGLLRQRRIGEDDVCAICQDELLSEQRYPVTYCRKGCGNSVHIRCMRVWMKHQRKDKSLSMSDSVPCPLCREEFGTLGLLLREIPEDDSVLGDKITSSRTTSRSLVSHSLQPNLPVQHPSTQCTECKSSPIFGKIYRCQLCEANNETVLLCSKCFQSGLHLNHDEFTYRESPNGKWLKVGANRGVPFNLGQSFRVKVDLKNQQLSSADNSGISVGSTLSTSELSVLPHWTVRAPRKRIGAPISSGRRSSFLNSPAEHGDVHKELKAASESGQIDGYHARLADWGSITTSGLLAPGRQCRICLMTYQIGDVVRRLEPGCQHIFHTACIDPWLIHKSATCPLDGKPVVSPSPHTSSRTTPRKQTQPTVEGVRLRSTGFANRLQTSMKNLPCIPIIKLDETKAQEPSRSAQLEKLSIVGQTITSSSPYAQSCSSHTNLPSPPRRMNIPIPPRGFYGS
ncbi:unnamed protein product [Calicophoron daubneyi]|uniref:E3 ubiquitin-protein ligase ZSWIM2 n=1 Tax=Calicophoron daubneyi TaxID=300641 RepID=A0AAV2TEA9_CALDB